MRGVVAAVVILLAGAVSAQVLTVPEVIAAQRAGAPLAGILRLIGEAPAVAPLAASDLARLRAAGVPEAAIEAMVARTAPPTPMPPRPDDPRLVDVVRMVQAGVAERLVVEQLRRSGVRYAPTANDLVYLATNNVPEPVIAELLAGPAPPAPVLPTPVPPPVAATATPRLPETTSFGPLVRLDGPFRRQSRGRVTLAADALGWQGPSGTDADRSITIASLKGFWLFTQPLGQTATLSELRMLSRSGDEIAFRDADWADGGSTQVLALYRTLAERFPQMHLRERPAR